MNAFNNKYTLNNKKDKISTTWLMILTIFILIFLNISFNYKYKNYDHYKGYIKKIDNSFKVVIYVLENEVSEIYKYNLLIDNLKYEFNIKSISEQCYIMENNKYYEIILDIPLKKQLLIENNIINIVLEKEYTTIYKQLKKGIKKWIN